MPLLFPTYAVDFVTHPLYNRSISERQIEIRWRCCDEEKKQNIENYKIDSVCYFYNINGDKDYQTNYKLAQEYFEQISAPYKQMYLNQNMTHGLLESDSERFSEIIHQIAEIERTR